jgi:hypothetical protein
MTVISLFDETDLQNIYETMIKKIINTINLPPEKISLAFGGTIAEALRLFLGFNHLQQYNN